MAIIQGAFCNWYSIFCI